MKLGLAILSLSFLVAPAFAMADDTAPVGTAAAMQPSPEQRQAFFQTMERFRTQSEQLHAQARTTMLAALSPAHRTALASIAGQLAVAANPDPAAAARQLDAVLSSSEQSAIVRTSQSLATQERSLHEQMRAQFESSLTADQRAQMPKHAMRAPGTMPQQSTDAGTLLLRATAVHFEPPFGPPHGM